MKLEYKILLSIYIILGTVGLIAGFILVNYQNNLRLINFKSSGEAMTTTIVASMEKDMIDDQLGHIDSVVEKVGQIEDINEVVIFDHNGIVRSSAELDEIGTDSNDEGPAAVIDSGSLIWRSEVKYNTEEYCIIMPILNKPDCVPCHADVPVGQALGAIEVGFDVSDLNHQTRNQWLLIGGFGFVGFVILGGALFYVFRKLVARRLANLGKMAAQVANGNYTVRSMEKGNDYISHLGRSFDDMAEQLDKHNRELLALQKDLEIKVERRAEQLEAARNYTRATLDNLPDQIISVDLNYRIKSANRAMYERLGLAQKEVIGKFCYKLTHNNDRPCNECGEECPIDGIKETGLPCLVHHKHYGQNGIVEHVEVVAAPIRDKDDNIVEIIEIMHDISDRVNSENEIKKHAAERTELLKRLISVQEDERKRIARDLHDDVGQTLTALGLLIGNAAEELDNKGKITSEKLQDAKKQSDQALSDIRRLVSDLRPSVLDDLGLIPAIRSYIKDRLRAFGLKVNLKVKEPIPRLRPEKETQLFRIIQEAGTNILRHAQASKVDLSIVMHNGFIFVTVQDDGIGFDSKDKLAKNKWGLYGIEERVSNLEGSLKITSSPGQGTRIKIGIEVDEDDDNIAG